MKLRFTPRAAANIANIVDYIRKRNPSAARRVPASIYDSLQNLLLFPLIGREQKEPGVRTHVTPRYAYLVYYVIDEVKEKIIILSVKSLIFLSRYLMHRQCS